MTDRRRYLIDLYNLSRSNLDTALKAFFEDANGCKVCGATRQDGMLMHEEDCQYFACISALWAARRKGLDR